MRCRAHDDEYAKLRSSEVWCLTDMVLGMSRQLFPDDVFEAEDLVFAGELDLFEVERGDGDAGIRDGNAGV